MAKKASRKAVEKTAATHAAVIPTHGQPCGSLRDLRVQASRFLGMCEHRIDNGTFPDDPELQAAAVSLREYLSKQGGEQCPS